MSCVFWAFLGGHELGLLVNLSQHNIICQVPFKIFCWWSYFVETLILSYLAFVQHKAGTSFSTAISRVFYLACLCVSVCLVLVWVLWCSSGFLMKSFAAFEILIIFSRELIFSWMFKTSTINKLFIILTGKQKLLNPEFKK